MEGLTLSYEEGTPVVTLDGATIKQAGGPNATDTPFMHRVICL